MGFKDNAKAWFKKGMKPTEIQFSQVFNWLRWKDETILTSEVNQLDGILATKAERAEQIQLRTEVNTLKADVNQIQADNILLTQKVNTNEQNILTNTNDINLLREGLALGLRDLEEITLETGVSQEFVLPENSMLLALDASGTGHVKVGSASGLDDYADGQSPTVLNFGFFKTTSVWLQADTAVVVRPIIFQM